jgi:hypothetical protein
VTRKEGFGEARKVEPRGEHNMVDLTLGGAKSPTEFIINVVGEEAM